jgi:hypothetical protein
MNRKEALQEVVASIEAENSSIFESVSTEAIGEFTQGEIDLIKRAHHGSLDSAKAVHDAVLPEWSAIVNTNGAAQLHCPINGAKAPVYNSIPARAWLTAILKALIAMEGDE